MANFKLITQTPDGNTLFEVPYESLSLTEELNKGISGNLAVSYPDIKKYANALNVDPDDIFATQQMEWYLKRDGVDIMGGIFLNRKISGDNTGMTQYLVSLADFSALLDKRRTAQLFQRLATDSADIVEDLLDYTNGIQATGIVMGLKPTTKNRNLTSEFESIREAIVSLSALKKKDGYDWDVDVIKKLNLHYPKGDTNAGIIFDEFNTLSFSSTRNLQGNLTNKAIVLGKGNGDAMPTATRENTTSQSTWGLLEDVLAEKGVETVSELQDRGDQFIDDNAFPSDVITIQHRDGSPDMTSYDVGDTVRVVFRELDIDTQLRVYKRQIQISPDGDATIGLSFE